MISKFLPGHLVKWERKNPYENPFLVQQRIDSVQKYLQEHGPGPYEVVRVTEASKHTPPQVIIQTKTGQHQFGEGWFKRVLRLGDICPVCAREWKQRILATSFYIGCFCPEEKDET
jgi:hypothetical protein